MLFVSFTLHLMTTVTWFKTPKKAKPLSIVSVVSQSLCDGSSYLEVKEGRNNTFVCTGLTPQQKVYWSWASRLVSSCDTTSCNNIFGPNFQSSKIVETSSSIILYVSFPDLDYIANTNLSCQQESGSTKVTCQLDVVCKYRLRVSSIHTQPYNSIKLWLQTFWKISFLKAYFSQ